jgi:hypothetical protein
VGCANPTVGTQIVVPRETMMSKTRMTRVEPPSLLLDGTLTLGLLALFGCSKANAITPEQVGCVAQLRQCRLNGGGSSLDVVQKCVARELYLKDSRPEKEVAGVYPSIHSLRSVLLWIDSENP